MQMPSCARRVIHSPLLPSLMPPPGCPSPILATSRRPALFQSYRHSTSPLHWPIMAGVPMWPVGCNWRHPMGCVRSTEPAFQNEPLTHSECAHTQMAAKGLDKAENGLAMWRGRRGATSLDCKRLFQHVQAWVIAYMITAMAPRPWQVQRKGAEPRYAVQHCVRSDSRSS